MADETEQNYQSSVSELIMKYNCNVLQTTPSKMKAFILDKENCRYLSRLSTIILGGEVFPESLYRELAKYTDAHIYNIYGPSEATVWVSVERVRPGRRLAIGRPIANTHIYIVNKEGELVKKDEIGELCISGDCVGKGYINRPELTKEKFVDNPFGEGIMYKTGDLAKWLDDGRIEYHGRMDHQIKIHGLRIELGEIESAIQKIPFVKDAAVTARSENDDTYICAYIVSDDRSSIDKVIDILKKKLPAYMIPSRMMRLPRCR